MNRNTIAAKLFAACMAVALLFTALPASPADAYNIPGGEWDSSELADNQLTVCMEDSTSATYTNRAHIISFMNIWSDAVDITFVDDSNVEGICIFSDIRVKLEKPWRQLHPASRNKRRREWRARAYRLLIQQHMHLVLGHGNRP